MSRQRKGMNRHQKAAHRPGEHRVRGAEIERLIALAASDVVEERLEAAENLCPCHVRRRVEEAWHALYRLMADPDARVRWAAWHTLEDGGCPTDAALEPIFERAVEVETDPAVRRFVDRFAVPYLQQREERRFLQAAHSPYGERGRCDFCGEANVPVRRAFDTEIGAGGEGRFARICRPCDG